MYMKSKSIFIIAIAALVLIGIVGFLLSQKKAPATSNNTITPQVTKEAPTGVMPDFAKAMQGSGEMKCTYDINGVTQTSYIKNGKIRMEITTNGVINNTLMLNKVVYSWASNSKKGFMMDTSSISVSVTPSAGSANYKDMDSVKKDLETYKPTCTNETLADSMFEKPTAVTFTDFSKMMDDIKSKMPANVTIPVGYKAPGQ